jgi:hypothetical protein
MIDDKHHTVLLYIGQPSDDLFLLIIIRKKVLKNKVTLFLSSIVSQNEKEERDM